MATSDADSARLIEELLRQPGAPPLMLIAVYRTEDRDASELVRVLRMVPEHADTEVRDLLVGPLGTAVLRGAIPSEATEEWERRRPRFGGFVSR